jgi:mannose-6-phosphate isomerase
VLRISRDFPGDIGIVAPLVLNVFCLEPGEATFQPAGVLHAYLEGTGAELMANSDNVLRGGMTGKHIDVDELLAVGVFESETPLVIAPRPLQYGQIDCAVRYESPFDEFELVSLSVVDSVGLHGGVPQIVFCHEGALRLCTDQAQPLTLSRGESAFVTAAESRIEVRGRATAFVARVPE